MEIALKIHNLCRITFHISQLNQQIELMGLSNRINQEALTQELLQHQMLFAATNPTK